MSRIKIAITGGSGQLGTEFMKLSGAFDTIDCRSFNKKEFDICHESDYDVLKNFDIILNCAAYTAVDRAEEEAELAFKINAEALQFLGSFCKENGIKLIHFSTDYVFDGNSDEPYSENAPPSPINVYGASKLLGERILQDLCPDAIIFRISWLYSNQGKNFFLTMKKLGDGNSDLKVVNDQIASPTYAGDVCTDIFQLIISGEIQELRGLYHYAQDGECTWFDFAKEIFKLTKQNPKLIATSSADFAAAAPRPAYSKLDNSRLINSTELLSRSWQSGLENCFGEKLKDE